MTISRRTVRVVAFALILLPALLAAEPKPEAEKATLVTVTRADRTTVRGRLVSSDPDNLIVKPSPKPGQKETPEDVTIAWTDVKSVSNGLTQAKALAAWKEQHIHDLCPTCHGDRTVLCDVCKGTMHDPASAKDCPTCKGELLVPCKTPKCDGGKIPCPRTCLKLTDPGWTKHADGQMWKRFSVHGGYMEYSEHHVGDLIVLNPKTGQYDDMGKCPTCGGTGKIDDPACHGVGKMPCPTCLNRKDAPPCPAGCDHGRVKCKDCDGTGLKKA